MVRFLRGANLGTKRFTIKRSFFFLPTSGFYHCVSDFVVTADILNHPHLPTPNKFYFKFLIIIQISKCPLYHMILLGKILKICTITPIWIIPMWFKPGFSKLRHVAPPSLSGSLVTFTGPNMPTHHLGLVAVQHSKGRAEVWGQRPHGLQNQRYYLRFTFRISEIMTKSDVG